MKKYERLYKASRVIIAYQGKVSSIYPREEQKKLFEALDNLIARFGITFVGECIARNGNETDTALFKHYYRTHAIPKDAPQFIKFAPRKKRKVVL